MITQLFKTLILLTILITSTARAKNYDGIQFPKTIDLNRKALKLNGQALEAVTIFDIDVFVAALYLEQKMTEQQILDPKTTAEFTLHFVQDADSQTVNKYFLQTFDSACEKECGKLKPLLSKHLDKMPALKEGDIIRFQFYNNKVFLSHNKKVFGEFQGKDWHKTFVSFFIGKDAPSTTFSNNLLGI